MSRSSWSGESLPRRLAELSERLGRSFGLDATVSTTLRALDELFDYEHSLLLLLDEDGRRLYTIGSRGYPAEGVGSEVGVGDGIIGEAAARARPMRVGNLGQMLSYARNVRRTFEETGRDPPGQEIALPGLPNAESQLAATVMAGGELVGVLGVESDERLAFGSDDEALLVVVATLVAGAIEINRVRERAAASATDPAQEPPEPAEHSPPPGRGHACIRFYPVDGSVFVDDEYLIKGVAGRVLWTLLRQYTADGRTEFTNREIRLDPTVDLPPFKDNLESRLILLKRRLDERECPVRMEKTGRGRFRVVVSSDVELVAVGDDDTPETADPVTAS